MTAPGVAPKFGASGSPSGDRAPPPSGTASPEPTHLRRCSHSGPCVSRSLALHRSSSYLGPREQRRSCNSRLQSHHLRRPATVTGIFVAWYPSRLSSSAGWVEDGSGCHIWTGALDKRDYGRVAVNRRMRRAARVRYEREVGPIPPGMQLDHSLMPERCSRTCCNPAHLRPTTSRENVLRGIGPSAQNARKVHCKRGHTFSRARMDWLSGRPGNGKLKRKGWHRLCQLCINALQRERRRRASARRTEPKRGAGPQALP